MIEIKYPEGHLEIYLEEFFKTGSVRTFRRLLKMSVRSDMIYGTNLIAEWKRAVNEELLLLDKSWVRGKPCKRRKQKLEKLKFLLEALCPTAEGKN